MSTLLGLSYQLEPRADQEATLLKFARSVRWTWNYFIAYREEALLAAKSAGGKLAPGQLSYIANCKHLTQLRRSINWLNACNSDIQRQALRDQDHAFSAFFRGGGHPGFRSRNDRQSFRFPSIEATHIKGDKVRLPGVGWVHFRKSRPVIGEIRNATIVYDGGKWSVVFCVKGDFRTENAGGESIGIDLGVAQSAACSNGEVFQFPTMNGTEDKKSLFLQRKIARQQNGSVRRLRTASRLSKLRRHGANRVKDFQHKVSTRLARDHAVVVVEDLKLAKMTQSPSKNINRSMRGNAHGRFRSMLAYKCARSGAKLISVPAAYTSQRCAICSHVAKENRESQAKFKCVNCGHENNADINASLNILAAGLAVSARGGTSISSACESRNQGEIEV